MRRSNRPGIRAPATELADVVDGVTLSPGLHSRVADIAENVGTVGQLHSSQSEHSRQSAREYSQRGDGQTPPLHVYCTAVERNTQQAGGRIGGPDPK